MLWHQRHWLAPRSRNSPKRRAISFSLVATARKNVRRLSTWRHHSHPGGCARLRNLEAVQPIISSLPTSLSKRPCCYILSGAKMEGLNSCWVNKWAKRQVK